MNEDDFLENQFQPIIFPAPSPSPSSAGSSDACPTTGSRSRVKSCTKSPHSPSLPSVSIDFGTLSPSTHHHTSPDQKIDVDLCQDEPGSPLSDNRVSARQKISVTKISNDSSLGRSRRSIILILSEHSTRNLQERLRV